MPVTAAGEDMFKVMCYFSEKIRLDISCELSVSQGPVVQSIISLTSSLRVI